MKYDVTTRVLNKKQLIGYKLKVVGGSDTVFITVEDLIDGLRSGSISLQGVKLTSTGTLRGCDGFHLSKLPETSIRDLSEINADLLSVLVYVFKQLFPKPYKDTKFGAEIKGLTAYYYVDTRSEDYYNMTHMDATDDLHSSLDFYMTHLPKELDSKVDDMYGEIGDKGHLRITVSKNIEL